MNKPIVITFEKKLDMKGLYAKAKRDAAKYSIPFSGDENGGSGEKFGVKGYFEAINGHLTITVTKKPPIASETKIRNLVLNYCREFFIA